MSVPFLGLEASAAGTQSVADTLLDNARRMTSVDAYRLATIVDAYVLCAKALQFRVKREPACRLDFRVKNMARNLKEALGDLSVAIDRVNSEGTNLQPERKEPISESEKEMDKQ